MKTEVPVGVTSVAGWGSAFVAFVAALLAYLTGDHTAQTVTAVEIGGASLVMLGVTNWWRYKQAHKQKETQGAIQKVIEELGIEPDELATALVKAIEERGGLLVQLPVQAQTAQETSHAQSPA